MSREIKFRVWDSSLDNMISHELIVKLQLFGLALVPTNQTQPMQYTGLKDKNGIEIYEGDIVRLVDLGFGDLGCYEVEFNDDSAGFLMCFNQEIRHFIDHHPEEEIEVIGNIHDNPELMVEAENE